MNDVIPTLFDLLAADDDAGLQKTLQELPAADIADEIDMHFDIYPVLALLDKMSAELQAEVFGYLEPKHQLALASHMELGLLSKLFRDMSSDERADVFALLDIKLQDALMRRLAKHERQDLLRLASYDEGTVGSIMTSDYVVIPATLTAEQALQHVRRSAPEKETIYQAYVVDADHHLRGVVSLRDIIMAAPTEVIEDLMNSEAISLTPEEPQAQAARYISRYDLIAIPVISEQGMLMGIVTFDDAMDVVETEGTETMHKSATVGKIEGGLKHASPFTLYRKRVNWLVLLVFANIFSGAGIAYYEETISTYISLLFFLPLLIASGGNAGAQAATLMVRGLATGEVDKKDWFRMMGKELIVSLALGITLALAISLVGSLRAGPDIMLVVALSMLSIVLIGSMIGLLLPFLLQRLNWDPATASGPLVTTIADTTGVLIYFGMATAILGLPAIS